MYEYRARALEVHDGDTVKLLIDLGLRTYHQAWVRLAHVNAPELKDAGGWDAKRRLEELVMSLDVPVEWPLKIRTIRDRTEKYGRWLAEIVNSDNIDVGIQLIVEGLARPYEGGRR